MARPPTLAATSAIAHFRSLQFSAPNLSYIKSRIDQEYHLQARKEELFRHLPTAFHRSVTLDSLEVTSLVSAASYTLRDKGGQERQLYVYIDSRPGQCGRDAVPSQRSFARLTFEEDDTAFFDFEFYYGGRYLDDRIRHFVAQGVRELVLRVAQKGLGMEIGDGPRITQEEKENYDLFMLEVEDDFERKGLCLDRELETTTKDFNTIRLLRAFLGDATLKKEFLGGGEGACIVLAAILGEINNLADIHRQKYPATRLGHRADGAEVGETESEAESESSQTECTVFDRYFTSTAIGFTS